MKRTHRNIENKEFDERIVRITDVLNQVKELNNMIALHREKSRDGFMLRQYEHMRANFLKELKDLLEKFEIATGELVSA